MATSSAVAALVRSPSFKWAAGGWTFFIAENLILSENRTKLIEVFGDSNYHNIYGAFSTAAVASIGYGYLYRVRNVGPFLWTAGPPLASRIAASALLSLGLAMASQTLPKFQVPFAYVQDGDAAAATTNVQAAPKDSSYKFKVQCPFDFTHSSQGTTGPFGVERVSRHPGLWSMACVGLGQALLVPSLPQRVWLAMPTFVALIGGWHTDSRYKRGMGGTLEHEQSTSNIPFLAMLQVGGWTELAQESKPINALLATGLAAAWAFRRGQVPAALLKAVK